MLVMTMVENLSIPRVMEHGIVGNLAGVVSKPEVLLSIPNQSGGAIGVVTVAQI